MLKIGVIRWRGKCSRHPGFDPLTDGPATIKGGCERCSVLMEIHSHHQRMLQLMRTFAPPAARKTNVRIDDSQPSLF